MCLSFQIILQISWGVRKMIFSIKVFVTLLDYLKIPQVTILGDLHISSSGFLYNSIAHQTACLTHPPSLLANRERLWTFDLDKSQEKGRYNSQGYKKEPLSTILCLHVCLAGVSTCLYPLDQEKIALSRFSVACVSVFGTRGLSVLIRSGLYFISFSVLGLDFCLALGRWLLKWHFFEWNN
jgi:hypothetical protein